MSPSLSFLPSSLLCSSDPGCNNSGYYELLAVLTHQGRSSSSGHYVGWVRHREGEEAVVVGGSSPNSIQYMVVDLLH